MRSVSFAHLTLPTRDVERTAALLADVFGYSRSPIPGNSPVEAEWLEIGKGQQLHVLYVPDFTISPFEGEFGRHVALFHRRADFEAMKAKLAAWGITPYPAERPTPFERFFFREPVNGYVIEVIDAARASMPAEP